MHFQGAQEPLARPCHRSPGVPSVPSEWQHSQLVAKRRNSVLVLSYVLTQGGLISYYESHLSVHPESSEIWRKERFLLLVNCELMLCSFFHPLTLLSFPQVTPSTGISLEGNKLKKGHSGCHWWRWHQVAFAGTRSAKHLTPSQLTPKRLQPNRAMVGGGWRVLWAPPRVAQGLGSDAQHRVCPLLQASCALCWELGQDSGFLVLAGLAGHRHSWGSIIAVPTALQSPPRSQSTAPAPVPLTTPFFFHFSHKHEKIEPPELPSWPLCLGHTIPALSPVPSSQLAAGHPQPRALELHYHGKAGAAQPGCPGELP